MKEKLDEVGKLKVYMALVLYQRGSHFQLN